MAVLLKNLLARTPKMEDLAAVTELIASCDVAEHGRADSTMEDLLSNWQTSGFNLATDAWVIVTTKGQIVGFAGVWHKDHEQISTFICVHPEYRSRGIGTLLLRLVEERARQHMRLASPGTRVTLSGTASSANLEARRLFEREGYSSVRQFWRIAIQVEEALQASADRRKLKVELDVEPRRVAGAAPLYEREGIYIIRQFNTYEKELRSGTPFCLDAAEFVNDLVESR